MNWHFKMLRVCKAAGRKQIYLAKLVYDKENVIFNVHHGEYLYFADDGACYILQIK